MTTTRASLLKYLRNTAWLLGGRATRMALTVAAGIVVARYLGPQRFGDLSFAFSFVALFTPLSEMGLERILVRDLVRSPESRDELLGTAFGLRLAGALLLVGLAMASVRMLGHSQTVCALVGVVALGALFHPVQVITAFLYSQVRGREVALAECISTAGAGMARIGLALAGAALVWFGWAVVLEAAFLAAMLVRFYGTGGGRLRQWRCAAAMGKSLVGDAWPLVFSGAMAIIYMRIDQVMLMEMAGSDAVGLYAAAVKISEALYFVPVTLTAALAPVIVNARQTSPEHFSRRMQQLLDMLFLISACAALLLSLRPGSLVVLVFGEAYQAAGSSLVLLAWAGVFVFLGVGSSQWLVVENLQRWSMVRSSLGCLSNIVLNYYAIPRYGIEGAAMSTLISYGIVTFGALGVSSQCRPLLVMMLKTPLLPSLFARDTHG